jgi:hypothetical protein
MHIFYKLLYVYIAAFASRKVSPWTCKDLHRWDTLAEAHSISGNISLENGDIKLLLANQQLEVSYFGQ